MSPLDKALKIIVDVADPERVILFGSHALGTQNDSSDYDFLVIKNGDLSKRKLAQKIYLNMKNIGAPVDILVSDSKSFEFNKTNPYLIYSKIASEGKIVYEQ